MIRQKADFEAGVTLRGGALCCIRASMRRFRPLPVGDAAPNVRESVQLFSFAAVHTDLLLRARQAAAPSDAPLSLRQDFRGRK